MIQENCKQNGEREVDDSDEKEQKPAYRLNNPCQRIKEIALECENIDFSEVPKGMSLTGEAINSQPFQARMRLLEKL